MINKLFVDTLDGFVFVKLITIPNLPLDGFVCFAILTIPLLCVDSPVVKKPLQDVPCLNLQSDLR